MRRLTGSTLFPYTTLFRSGSMRADDHQFQQALQVAVMDRQRSEEHTSELQSRFDLVCRLLLEKKNTAATRRFVARAGVGATARGARAAPSRPPSSRGVPTP